MNSTRYIARKYALLVAFENQTDKNLLYKATLNQLLVLPAADVKALISDYTNKVNSKTTSVNLLLPTNPNTDDSGDFFTFTPVQNTGIEDYEYDVNYLIGTVDDNNNAFIFSPAAGKSIEDYEIQF